MGRFVKNIVKKSLSGAVGGRRGAPLGNTNASKAHMNLNNGHGKTLAHARRDYAGGQRAAIRSTGNAEAFKRAKAEYSAYPSMEKFKKR
jgi:hypothetical protein